jgi:hypothetical protein
MPEWGNIYKEFPLLSDFWRVKKNLGDEHFGTFSSTLFSRVLHQLLKKYLVSKNIFYI